MNFEWSDKYMGGKKVKETNVNTQNAYNDFDIYWKNNKDNIINTQNLRE